MNISKIRPLHKDSTSEVLVDCSVNDGVEIPDDFNAADKNQSLRTLGTWTGVFRPTILTIFGVMMYIRMGWIVGHAGLIGALLILGMTFFITGSTALSFSSISTNMRLKAGGIFAMVSQSLGLEAGGAIGLPLYLAQCLGAAMYIYGFAEGWIWFFPEHDPTYVIVVLYLVGATFSLISEKMVLKMQGFVAVGVVVALISMVCGFATVEVMHEPVLWGDFEGGSIWFLFAVFFPAGTGIKVGASLSGKLKDPRKSIPIGVLAAWGVALVMYAILMVWYSLVATPAELQGNYLIAMDRAWWGKAVLIGLLSSCFSAMLSSMIAAPNVLAALGEYRVIPKGDFLSKQSAGGTPRQAVLVNSLIVGLALTLGDLNTVAQVVTMFFLITYATINLVVMIEQSLGLLSFRPTFKVSKWVPRLGFLASIGGIMITNPWLGLGSVAMVIALYAYLESRKLDTPWDTVRSGLFFAMASWAARRTMSNTGANERGWKPDLIVPIDNLVVLEGYYRFLVSMLQPNGSLQLLYWQSKKDETNELLLQMVDDYNKEGIISTHTIISSDSLVAMTRMGVSVLRNQVFHPNILFIDGNNRSEEEVNQMIQIAKSSRLGAILCIFNEEKKLGREKEINIWIRDQSPDWSLGLRLANLDLTLLLSYQVRKSWGGRISLLSVIREPEQLDRGREYLNELFRDARIPGNSHIWVDHGDFHDVLTKAPRADLNIFGLSEKVDLAQLKKLTVTTRSSCIFVMDSGDESALA